MSFRRSRRECFVDLERNQIEKSHNHLITFLANIDPGGAVGGRFIRIFDANGTSDARRMFADDKSIAFGSLVPTISSSSWNDTEIYGIDI